MEKCKTEQFGDEITAGNADAQMPPNAAENADGQMNAGNADAQMPNENEAIAPIEVVANRRKIYKCSKCPAEPGGKIRLNEHEAIHNRRGNPSYPINCPHCDASFDDHRGLAQHNLVHQRILGVKPQTRVVGPNAGTKRARPQANNDGAGAEEDNDAEVEIIEPPKKRVGRPRKLVPRRVAAAHNELVADVANAPGPSSAGPAGPSSISTIVKECAKSNGVLHNIELRDNDAVCKIGKIEFP